MFYSKKLKSGAGAILFATLLGSGAAQSAPVLNENMAVNTTITVYPDSVNKDLYYYTPQYLGLCSDEKGNIQFAYTEFRPKGLLTSKRGLMISTICMKRYDNEMNAAFAAIRAKNAKAQFVGLPFTATDLKFSDDVFSLLLENSACNHLAGVVGQEESCTVIFSPKGKEVFKKTLRSGLSIVLQYQYTVDGVIRLPAGLAPKTVTFDLAARISKSDFQGKLEDYLAGKAGAKVPSELVRLAESASNETRQ